MIDRCNLHSDLLRCHGWAIIRLLFYKCYIIFVLYTVHRFRRYRTAVPISPIFIKISVKNFWTLTGLYSIKFIIERTTTRVSIEFYSGPHWMCLFYVSYRPKSFWTRHYWQNPYGNFRTDMLYRLFVKDNILNTFPPLTPHHHTHILSKDDATCLPYA